MKLRILSLALLLSATTAVRAEEPELTAPPVIEPAEPREVPKEEPKAEPKDVPAEEEKQDPKKAHKDSSGKLASRQDELSADVQQLALEQTVQKVIDLLKECEDIMGEATERLMDQDTGGETIAAQTEVIEKIYQAAKAKQQQKAEGKQGEEGKEPQEGEAGSAMMEMMERMMGKGVQGDGQGPPQPGEQASSEGGGGLHGLSDTANTPGAGGPGDGKQEQRKVPKAAGVAGKALPEEFRGALDAYNRGAGKLPK